MNLLSHIKDREGVVYESYLDSLDKPTGGVGHLLTQEEQLLYPIKYVDNKAIGTPIPESVVNAWLEKDLATAKKAAKKQASQLNNPATQEFENALVSVNFQLGQNWTSKFPTAWKHLKNGKYNQAIQEVKFADPTNKPGMHSDWYKQTKTRVNDFEDAIIKFRDGVEAQLINKETSLSKTQVNNILGK
jgi:GH24 family phage-related lysozyme (muramidase)